jgi:hypothetical protein
MSAILLCAYVLTGTGCTSTQERFEKASRLQAKGRHGSAAEQYIRVLSDDRRYPGAREGLQTTGDLAVSEWLGEAVGLVNGGQHAQALGRLDRIDGLRSSAAKVGVTLLVPPHYATYRQSVARDAIVELRQKGESASAAGKWGEALEAYGQAARYASDSELVAAIDEERAGVHLRWAEQEMQLRHFRSAHERAGHVLGLVSAEHVLAGRAETLQASALTRGTKTVAFLPLWQTDDVDSLVSAGLLQDLNDVLQYEHWSANTPFVEAADPVTIRRALRRSDLDRTALSRHEAARVGREAAAELVVVGAWTRLERHERQQVDRVRKVRFKRRAVPEGGARDTSFVEQRYRLVLDAEVSFRIIEVHARRQVEDGKADASVSGQVTRALFAGDYRDLDLTGAQRDLFEGEREAVDALTDELLEKLAPRLAEAVRDRLLSQIP